MIGKNSNQKILRAKSYLSRFDKIFEEMEKKMLEVNIDNEIAVHFLESIEFYNKYNIYICKTLLEYIPIKELEELVRRIIEDKSKRIENIKEIKMTMKQYTNIEKDIKEYSNEYINIIKNMSYMVKNGYRCTNIQLNYINEMIPILEAGINICNNVFKYYLDSRLKQLRERIIVENNKIIGDMNIIKKNLI